MNDFNEIINYNSENGSFTTGVERNFSTYSGFFDSCYPYIERYYPTYYPIYHDSPNKTESAFKIVGKLMEKGLIKNISLKKFIELVNEIAKEVL